MIGAWSPEKQQAVFDYMKHPEKAKADAKTNENAQEALRLIKVQESVRQHLKTQ